MTAIAIRKLTAAYEGNIILNEMNLSIPEGKISIIIGSNGCGKSTLLKTIARVLKYKKGSIQVDGAEIRFEHSKKLAKKIAFLPQSPICPSGLTVKELVAFGRFPHQKSIGGLTEYDKKMVEWAIEETGLSKLANRTVENLSGGQRQRAWIAMALAQETKILLLDEPTTYLDISYQLEILELLKRLNQERKTTIVLVLHELNNACRFADYIVGLKNGSIICKGKPSEVITKKNLQKIYGIEAYLKESDLGGYPICTEFQLAR